MTTSVEEALVVNGVGGVLVLAPDVTAAAAAAVTAAAASAGPRGLLIPFDCGSKLSPVTLFRLLSLGFDDVDA